MPRTRPSIWISVCLSLLAGSVPVAFGADEPAKVALLPAAHSAAPLPVPQPPTEEPAQDPGAAELTAPVETDPQLPGDVVEAPVAIADEVPLPSVPTPTVEGQSRFALGPGDMLKVTVWGYPELSEQIVILPDGTISYPLIGALPATGLTAQGLGDMIRQALEAHMESPQVSVVVTEMRSRHFSVMGEVRTAGVYPLWGGSISVLEAIAQAGGLTTQAIPNQVRIYRQKAESGEPVTLDLTTLLTGGATEPAELHAGDVLYVPSQDRQKKVCILGDVQQPGLYVLSPNMTVIDALTAAGWIKPSGVARSVMLVRRNEGGKQEFFRVDAKRAVEKQDWSQHLLLKPGDIIFVPKQFIAKVGDFTSFFTSKVEPAAHSYLRVYDAANPANVVVDR